MKATVVDHYDDPLGLGDQTAPALPPITATVTGLSEEEDAGRLIALRFNPDLAYCPSCEVVMDTAGAVSDAYGCYCPRCFYSLKAIGTTPLKRKMV